MIFQISQSVLKKNYIKYAYIPSFFSIRTLCRSLQYVAKNPCGNVQRSLYEVRVLCEVAFGNNLLGELQPKFP